MSAQASNDDVHELYEPLRTLIELSLNNGLTSEQFTDAILRLLDRQHLVQYATAKQLRLLNSHGRVLVAILEDPGITQRALSQYIGVSESNINISVNKLLQQKLITKTKVKGKNTYHFNAKEAIKHPDISRFLTSVLPHISDLLTKKD